MSHALHMLENGHWQAGILPGTGASLAFGRVSSGDGWMDVLRPTAESDYGRSSSCSSFVMLPWANRIGGGCLTFGGETYRLATSPDDNTARHGDVRQRAFTVVEASPDAISLTLDSRTQTDVNWPFAYRADATYRLDGPAFVWELALTNLDTRPYPAGFGHHPYFVRPAEQPILQIPCAQYFALVNSLAVAAPAPVTPRLDFRAPRQLAEQDVFDDLLTGRMGSEPVRLSFPDRGVVLEFQADPVFAHWIVYAPAGKPFFAVEPQTNANDGFALYERGVAESGVFVLAPGETRRGSVRLIHL